jgi:hypothetical protein
VKTLIPTIAAFALILCAAPAIAHVVEVTTSVAMTRGDDEAQIKQALVTEIKSVLQTTIAFTPTLVALTDAWTQGDRLYVRLLLADAKGEETLKELTGEKELRGRDAPSLDAVDRVIRRRQL